jgi:serine/threonine-protein kinase
MDHEVERLFGALALQGGLISAEQLVEACEAWRWQGGQSLAQALVERRFLSPETRAELDLLVSERIQEHQGDVRKALCAISDPGILEVLEEVQVVGSTEATVNYRATEASVQLLTIDWKGDARARYTLTRVQGKGGLGRVWLAHDEHLHREVALKEVLPANQDDLATQSLLLKEAQITGQLEHPNIVPVYELTRGQDEKPFYTMRFLRGRSLWSRIRAYHRDGKRDPLELRALLTCFVSVCNALAYAHARGVIHRDLKPENIMLGDFGAVMVVDWGLAKLVSQAEEHSDLRKVEVTEAADMTVTQEGKLTGSPAYMAPEQADGQIGLLDQRTDIYGLGAMLFAILSGHPPHKGTSTGNAVKDTMSLVRQISEGPTPRLRELDSSVPRPLDAICARAMAKKRSERYRTASELAHDVTCWLADEPVSVYRPPWRERLMRWLRRHRTFTQAAAVTLVLVALVAGVAALLISRSLEAEKRAHEKAEHALEAERTALENERLARTEAIRRFKDARDAVDKSLIGVSEALQYFPGVDRARRELLEKAAADYARFAQEKSNDPELRLESARALLRLGDVRKLLDQYGEAEAAYVSAEKVLGELAEDPQVADESQFELAIAWIKLGVLRTVVGPHATAETYFKSALDKLAALSAAGGDAGRLRYEQAGALISFAVLRNKTSQFDLGRQLLEKAEQLLESEPSDEKIKERLARARSNLGQQLLMLGRSTDAVAKLRAAIAAYRTLANQSPDHPPYFEGLAAAKISLANAERILGRDADVVATYKGSVTDYQDLLKARPGVPFYIEGLAGVRTNLAQMLHVLGRNKEAKEQATLALSDLIDLVNSQPDIHRYHEAHAACTQTLGLILRDLNETELADKAFRAAIRKFQDLVAKAQDVPGYRRRLAGSLSSLGRLQYKTGKLAAAEEILLEAMGEFQKVVKAGLNDPFTQDSLAWCDAHLGDVLRQAGKADKARDYYANALAIRENLRTQPEHLYTLGWFLATCDDPQFRDPERAVRVCRQAIELAPDNARYANGLGMAWYRAGKWNECIQAVQEAEKRRSEPSSYDLYVLALAYAKQGNKEQATRCNDQACKLMDQNCPGNIELAKLRTEAAESLKSLPR